MVSIFSQFEKSVGRFGKKKAIGFFKGDELVFWSYQELYKKILAISEGFRKLGYNKGDRVAILSENRAEWVVVDLAVARGGMVLVPIHITLSPEQIRRIIRQSRVRGLVIGKSTLLQNFHDLQLLLPGLESSVLKLLRRHFPSLQHLILLDGDFQGLMERKMTYFFSELEEEGEKSLRRKRRRSSAASHPSDLSTILYTSGTTGEMKGVLLSHGGLVENAVSCGNLSAASSQDLSLSILPLSHAFERTVGLLTPLFLGCTIVYGRGPNHLLEDLQIVRPTWMTVVPRLLEKVSEAIHRGIERKLRVAAKILPIATPLFRKKIRQQLGSRLTFFSCGGAPLSPEIGYFFQSLGITVLEGYGLTEASPVVTMNPRHAPKFGTVGIPLPKVKLKFGEDDEILVKGPNVMIAYDRNPQETRRAIDPEGWLHTGDQGALDREGYLHIKGRFKEIIVTSYGKNVAPNVVEKELEKSPFVKQAMVCGEARPYLVALIVPERSALEDFARSRRFPVLAWSQLIRHAEVHGLIQKEIQKFSRSLAHHEQVKKFSLLPEEFTQQNALLTPTLKLRRSAIEEKYRNEISSLYRGSKP